MFVFILSYVHITVGVGETLAESSSLEWIQNI